MILGIIDQEELYVYETDPDNPRAYRYKGRWEAMTRVTETIPVKDGEPVEAELWFTRHGPVIHEHPTHDAAFAVRAAWLGPGMAPFLDADALPAERDPDQGWFATANQMNLPPGYPNDRDTVTYDWYAPTRHHRIAEELGARTDWTVEDCVRLQTDTVSLPARRILPLLADLAGDDELTARAIGLLRHWDADVTADSAAAALFEIWYRRHLRPAVFGRALQQVAPDAERAAALAQIQPPDDPTCDPRVGLDLLTGAETTLDPGTLLATLTAPVADLCALLGPDPAAWTWGALHHARVHHPVTALHDGPQPPWASVGPAPRGGSGDTVGVAPYGADFRQTTGATFRLVVDVGSWDDSVARNSPGQSGNPDSEHYSDLFATWAADGSFPLLYTREQVAKHTTRTITLRPPAPATTQDPNGR
ncbi:penicillin acylase family protein [Streptomyces sp. NPDC056656]|uniref:penicillin acylase family protein n=1 Tax=Streptomyces sp. NPDC056656 TaxID=3345895 RepID=UPI003678DA9F